MEAIAVQHQIRENAAYLQDYYSDMKLWEKSMAKKELSLKSNTKKAPPVRVRNTVAVNVRGSEDSVSIQHPINAILTPSHESKAAPASHVYDKGYTKWDTFDVEAALKEVDEPSVKKTVEQPVVDTPPKKKVVTKNAPTIPRVSREVLEKENGNAHFKAGEYAAAVKCYTRSLGYNPRNAIVLSNRAMAHLKLKEYLKAEQDTTLAIQIDANHVKSYSRRATARNALGKHHLALLDLEAALALEPQNKTIHAQVKSTRETLKLSIKRAPLQSIPVTIIHPPVNPIQEADASPIAHVSLKPQEQEKPKRIIPKIQVKIPSKAPTTSYEFNRVWKSFKHTNDTLSLRHEYLTLLHLDTLPKLFKDSIESDLLLEIVQALELSLSMQSQAEFAITFLQKLATLPRFDMVLRFLSKDEKAQVSTLINQALHLMQQETHSIKEFEAMVVQVYTYDLFEGRTLHVSLFQNVKNAPDLLKRLLAQEIDFALINADKVGSLFPLHVAASRTLLCSQTNSLTTNTLHSELVFNLSGSRNVTDSLRRFGIAQDTTSLLVCAFDANAAKIAEMQSLVDGTLVDLNIIESKDHLSPEKLQQLKKHYKISDIELSITSLSDAIVSRIATKSVNK
ncbi:RNA polymerase II-associated protein [Thraustotheca clavata]|uniref:RNA polymerase II-associated protein 3 n=1 Tax=Thraustotheca clavata TaxID=74557 RepID=A0A1V9YWT7_9STRA|nr:RNA polymerase II-associated protein [Thraustotheca clavata]